MKAKYTEAQIIKLAIKILDKDLTVTEAAIDEKVCKSTVHNYVAKYLWDIDEDLAFKVGVLLERHFKNRGKFKRLKKANLNLYKKRCINE